jgi:FkbM family methyltransferase
MALGLYEREEIRFFLRNYKHGMTFLDVGANVGLYTALALKASKLKTRILCIEPHAESMHYLSMTVRSNVGNGSHVLLEPVAVGAKTGLTYLYSNPENKGDNRIYPDPLLGHQQAVELTTIDKLCEKHAIRSINFVKMDIQGAELEALKGATSVLTSSTDCILMIEFWAYGIRRMNGEPRECLSLLRNVGFNLFKVSGDNLIAVDDDSLVAKTSGRAYQNIIGLKGCHTAIAGEIYHPSSTPGSNHQHLVT